MLAIRLLRAWDTRILRAAMVFEALANGLAFMILSRMRSLGVRVGIWRTHKDLCIGSTGGSR